MFVFLHVIVVVSILVSDKFPVASGHNISFLFTIAKDMVGLSIFTFHL